MPANEQTWRNIPSLHRYFAASGVLLLIATLWVLAKDHNREWKVTQRKVVDVDTTMIRWRELQELTTDATSRHEATAEQVMLAAAQPIPEGAITKFASLIDGLEAKLKELNDSEPLTFNQALVASKRADLDQLSTAAMKAHEDAVAAQVAAEKAREEYVSFSAAAKKNNDPEVEARREAAEKAANEAADKKAAADRALAAAGRKRESLILELTAVADKLRAREDIVLGARKFKSAELDEAKALIDIGVRDSLPPAEMEQRQATVASKSAELSQLNLRYQARNMARVGMQQVLAEVTKDQQAAAKEHKAALAGLNTLEKQFADRQQTYFINTFPFLGKKILTLPILNAFGSPLKVQNLWSEGLMQDINFKKVRRFDRCTTCHQLLDRSLPGSPTDPAYIPQRDLTAWIQPPPAEAAAKLDKSAPLAKQLEAVYGLRLAGEGLIHYTDVSVSLVLPNSSAAKAEIISPEKRSAETTTEALREYVTTFSGSETTLQDAEILPGLVVGDVITGVGEDSNLPTERVATLLLDSVGKPDAVKLRIRRGLPNPYATHPRLDLFVSDSSPHKMSTFGCTICHEGQGNGTEFKWTSHTPNDGPEDPDESIRWAREYGWFDNHHWIYPMNPSRFYESGCLKCHHDVTELEPSERFPQPPAPKLVEGYHLIRKYGCYGCHEVNGYDGPNRRIGPDLRLEPNFFAVGLQLAHLLPTRLSQLEGIQAQAAGEDAAEAAALVERARRALDLAVKLADNNLDDSLREQLRLVFEQDAAAPAGKYGKAFTSQLASYGSMLKPGEAPGDLRKPGPSLRFVQSKLDAPFVYDWTANPREFRPSTRMPKFFGMWDHLLDDPQPLHVAEQFEPVELHGIVTYLQSASQTFVPVPKPDNIVPVESDEELEAQLIRGKQLFETRGCLACHEHQDFTKDVESDSGAVFPSAHKFRGEKEIVQGPDLSRLAAKFDPKRNPRGPEWLYSWIKQPTRYHARTVMPDLYLDPILVPPPVTGDAEADKNAAEAPKRFTDPVADIVAYLMDPEHLKEAGDWAPSPAAVVEAKSEDVRKLLIEYLRESFAESQLEQFAENGIPAALRASLKEAERDLIVGEGEKLTDQQRLRYLGRRTIAKYGCYGCHDIPGFEDAKPIGTGLADWGRKDPSKLAFEHITHYLEHGHGHAASHAHGEKHESKDDVSKHAAAETDAKPSADESTVETKHVAATNAVAAHGDAGGAASGDELPLYYDRALHHHNRASFIYQKLREPRSYDYRKAANKKYNDRLRMPQFPFSVEQREAVITFVLGLVADPPTEKYVYRPNERQAAILAGKKVLEKFNCGGCHILRNETWQVAAAPGELELPSLPKTYPFMIPSFDPATLKASAATNARGESLATLHGLPAPNPRDGLPLVFDTEGAELEAETKLPLSGATYAVDLYNDAAIGGQVVASGVKPIQVPASKLRDRFASEGGMLTKYLLPIVSERLASTVGRGKGKEAMGWLPPPLFNEGGKVQTEWLYDFLLNPYAIRPATVLRMPRFNLSADDTTKLVNYFAAVENAQYPYEFSSRRQDDQITSHQAKYEQSLAKAGSSPRNRLDDAMKIVVNNNYCVKCHIVGDFVPAGAAQAKGPDLAKVYKRLRPEYLRRWIALPTAILPYTAMPVNIPYDPENPQAGGVPQDLFHGSSTEQLDGLVDLLMNYDAFTRGKALVTPLVPPPPSSQPAAATSATEQPASTTPEASGEKAGESK